MIQVRLHTLDHMQQEIADTIDREKRKLMRGEIVIDLAFLPDDVIGVCGKIFIAAPPEAIWKTLTDYNNLSETLPKVLSSKLVGQHGNTIILDQTGRTGIFFFEKTVSFQLKLEEEYLKRVSFEQLNGDFSIYRGEWIIIPMAETEGFVLVYHAEIKPAFFAPPILVSFVQRQDLPGIFKAHKQRAESF
ncbi:MAG: SRPBCC family protein [Chlorobium sp.]|nr:SRPBCC family protein [Chlorobium sp.]